MPRSIGFATPFADEISLEAIEVTVVGATLERWRLSMAEYAVLDA
jgi:hypothetical protein